MNTEIKTTENSGEEDAKTMKFKEFIANAEKQLAQILVNFYKVRVQVAVILSGTIIRVYLGEEIQPSLTLVIGKNERTRLFEISQIKVNKGIYELDNAREKEALVLMGSLARNTDVFEKKALYYSYQYHKLYKELNPETNTETK